MIDYGRVSVAELHVAGIVPWSAPAVASAAVSSIAALPNAMGRFASGMVPVHAEILAHYRRDLQCGFRFVVLLPATLLTFIETDAREQRIHRPTASLRILA